MNINKQKLMTRPLKLRMKNKNTMHKLKNNKKLQVSISNPKLIKILRFIQQQRKNNTPKRVMQFTMTSSLVRVRKTKLIKMNELKSRKKRHKFMKTTKKTDTSLVKVRMPILQFNK